MPWHTAMLISLMGKCSSCIVLFPQSHLIWHQTHSTPHQDKHTLFFLKCTCICPQVAGVKHNFQIKDITRHIHILTMESLLMHPILSKRWLTNNSHVHINDKNRQNITTTTFLFTLPRRAFSPFSPSVHTPAHEAPRVEGTPASGVQG